MGAGFSVPVGLWSGPRPSRTTSRFLIALGAIAAVGWSRRIRRRLGFYGLLLLTLAVRAITPLAFLHVGAQSTVQLTALLTHWGFIPSGLGGRLWHGLKRSMPAAAASYAQKVCGFMDIGPSAWSGHVSSSTLRLVLRCVVHLWAVTEVAFFFCVRQLHRRYTLPASRPLTYTKAVRATNMQLIMDAMNDKSSPMTHEQAISGWFMGAPSAEIRKDNIREFMASSLFFSKWEDLTQQDKDEVDMWMQRQQDRSGMEYKEGYNPKLRCMKLARDPLLYTHRPLLYYGGHLALRYIVTPTVLGTVMGFSRKRVGVRCKCGQNGLHQRSGHQSRVYSFENTDIHRSAVSAAASYEMPFWHWSTLVSRRNGKSLDTSACACGNFIPRTDTCTTTTQRSVAVVFAHGIGIGLLPYAGLMAAAQTMAKGVAQSAGYDHVDLFGLEIAQLITTMTRVIPSSSQVVKCIAAMLKEHGYDSAVFVGHSFGTIVTSWCIKQRPSLVSACALLDPACFLQFLPTAPYSFIYRSPSTLPELIVHFFCSRDLFLAHYIVRHFYWWENILWPHEVPKNTYVLLSGGDELMPVASIRRYLQQHCPDVQCAWFEHAGHAQCLYQRTPLQSVLEWLGRAMDDATTITTH